MFFIFTQFHRTSVPYLWNHICQWLLLCIPAFIGHFGTLFQEATWIGEWHCHCWQQYLHNFAAFPFKGSDWECGPLLHTENPLHLHVCSLSGWLYLPTSCFQCQREREWNQRRQQILPLFQEKVQTSKKIFQFCHLQGESLCSVGSWNTTCTFWILCALCSLGEYASLALLATDITVSCRKT